VDGNIEYGFLMRINTHQQEIVLTNYTNLYKYCFRYKLLHSDLYLSHENNIGL